MLSVSSSRRRDKSGLLLRQSLLSRKSSCSWQQMSLKVTADLENSNRQRGRVENVHLLSFSEKATLKFSPPSASRQVQARGSSCQQVGELRLPFKHSSHSFHFHFCSSSLKTPPTLPHWLLRGVLLLLSEETSFNLHIIHIYKFNFPVLKTRRGPSTSVKGSIYHVSAAKKGFSWRSEIKSQTPLVIRRCSGARSWSAVSSSLFMFGGIFNTKCEKGDPRLLLHHADVELFTFLHPSHDWWDIQSVE